MEEVAGRWVVRMSRRYSEQVPVEYCSWVEGGQHIGYIAVEEEAGGRHIGVVVVEAAGNHRSLAEESDLDIRCRMAVEDNKCSGIAAAAAAVVAAARRSDHQRCNPGIPTCQDMNMVKLWK